MKIIRAAFVVSVLLFVLAALALAGWAWVDRYHAVEEVRIAEERPVPSLDERAPSASCDSSPVIIAEDP